VNPVSVTSASGTVTATANATGGNGGAGNDNATGGAGGAAVLVDDVTGSTSGSVTLNQTALGGNGGAGIGANAGSGGNATSELTFSRASGGSTTTTTTATGGNGANGSLGGMTGSGAPATSTLTVTGAAGVTATANATGGNGGAIVAGSLGAGGNGGSSNATVSATSTGVGAVTSTAMAIGGNGGAASSGPGGLGGNTMATATSVGSGTANATATADGGNGNLRSIFGSGIARANATGTGGSAVANALSAGGLIINIESHATAVVSGQSRAEARAGIGLAPLDASGATGREAFALATGLPTDTQTTNFFAGNGAVGHHFNVAADSTPGATSDIFGLVTLGGSNSEGGSATSRTFTSSVTYAIDLTSLTNPRQDLIVGLLDTNVEGNGFDTLNFQIAREGTMVVNETFMTAAAAIEYFDTNVLNLGSNGTGNVSGNLDLVFTMSLTTNDAGAGFYFDMAFGNSTINAGRPPGDYDQNGVVDAADHGLWRAQFGSTMSLDADGNGNGIVDAADYIVWRKHLGERSLGAPSVGATAVPEPSVMLLLAMGWIALVVRRTQTTHTGHQPDSTT
jgi:hypothetical protein